MRDEILSYHDLVGREAISLQKGMNYHVRPGYSIIAMSTRKNAPYLDRWDDDRGILIYEGHDIPQTIDGPDPKTIDQQLQLPSGKLTDNGKFFQAAKKAADRSESPELVRAYEKLDRGVWSDKGMFHLIDAEIVERNFRKVVDFFLQPIEDGESSPTWEAVDQPHTRLIPTHVKVEVWKRDKGKCVLCGVDKNLHYDHDLPFSKGGSSLTAENVRILCVKHNLQKSDRIE